MEFNESKVFMSWDADKLPIGSRCYFSNFVETLSNLVKEGAPEKTNILIGIKDKKEKQRFVTAYDDYEYAYLVGTSKEEDPPKPFKPMSFDKSEIYKSWNDDFPRERDSSEPLENITFDKTRAFSAINADQLPIGSLCYFANSLANLKKLVKQNASKNVVPLKKLWHEGTSCRFRVTDSECYEYAYLVKEPDNPNLFDSSKVYSSITADEIKVGSLCYFSNFVGELRDIVMKEAVEEICTLKQILGEDLCTRFVNEKGTVYEYVYLVEEPKEENLPKEDSRKLSTRDVVYLIDKLHGGWIKNIYSQECFKVLSYTSDKINIANIGYFTLDKIADNFVFADDGSAVVKPL